MGRCKTVVGEALTVLGRRISNTRAVLDEHMSVTRHVAAFGIGSTNFRYVVGTPSAGFRTRVHTEPTDAANLESQIVRTVDRLDRETIGGLDAVSIAVTGLVDHETGTITAFDTADGETIHDVPIADAVQGRFGLPVAVENDCTASAIGEYAFGAGQGYRSVVHVTFGTGIGGVVENGDALRGETGCAAEVGLIPVCADGDRESFGVRGAWEAYCSGRGMPGYVRSLVAEADRESVLAGEDGWSAKAVFEAAAGGDEVACDALDRLGRLNAAGIGALANVYNPGLITVGGGVALNNRDAILDGIRRHLDDYCYVQTPDIQVTELGDYIGLYGALGAFADESAPEQGVAVTAD